MTTITENEKAEMSTLALFITVQSTELTCHSTFASIQNRSSGFRVYSNRVLVSVFQSDGASQRGIVASSQIHFLYLYHYLLLDDQPAKRHIYDYMTESLC